MLHPRTNFFDVSNSSVADLTVFIPILFLIYKVLLGCKLKMKFYLFLSLSKVFCCYSILCSYKNDECKVYWSVFFCIFLVYYLMKSIIYTLLFMWFMYDFPAEKPASFFLLSLCPVCFFRAYLYTLAFENIQMSHFFLLSLQNIDGRWSIFQMLAKKSGHNFKDNF